MVHRGRWGIAGLVFCSMAALVVLACSDDSPPGEATPDSGTPSGDGSAPLNEASTGQPDGAVTTASCPEACTQTAASIACVGKTYDEKSCLEFCPCIMGAFRPEVVTGALACISDCRDAGGEDKCLADTYAPYIDDPETKDAVAACSSRQSECRDAGTSLGTDVCALYGAKPAFLAKIKSCLALSCTDARACIAAAYGEAGCGD